MTEDQREWFSVRGWSLAHLSWSAEYRHSRYTRCGRLAHGTPIDVRNLRRCAACELGREADQRRAAQR